MLLGLSHALIAVVLGVSLSLALSIRQEESLEAELLDDLRTQAWLWSSVLTFTGQQPGEPPGISGEIPARADKDLMLAFVSPRLSLHQLRGELMDDQVAKDALSIGGYALEGEPASREVYYGTLQRDEYLFAAVPVRSDSGEILGALCLIDPLEEFETGIRRTRTGLFWLGLGLAGVSLVGSLWLSNRITRRIADAQALVARVADGDYRLRLAEDGPAELSDLARDLNRMAVELEAGHRARETVVGNVTHELARPLGGLQLGIDSLRSGALNDPELAEELLESMSKSVQRVDDMVEDLALAARPAAQPPRLKITSVAVEPFMRGLISRHWPAANAKNIRFGLELEGGLPAVPADEKRLSQIMGNLLDNAIKYSSVGGQIGLSVRKDHGRVIFAVADSGPGITEKDIEHIFEPFFQGQQGQRAKAGLGLGLSIVHQLVLAHGGVVTLINRPEGGVCAEVELPSPLT